MVVVVDDFEAYLKSLVASWEAFAAANPGSVVVRDNGYVAVYFIDPVLNNAVVATPAGMRAAAQVCGIHPHAWWTNGADDQLTSALRAAGYREDITTRPMLLDLGRDGSERADHGHQVLRDVDPARIAKMNRVAVELVRGVRRQG